MVVRSCSSLAYVPKKLEGALKYSLSANSNSPDEHLPTFSISKDCPASRHPTGT